MIYFMFLLRFKILGWSSHIFDSFWMGDWMEISALLPK